MPGDSGTICPNRGLSFFDSGPDAEKRLFEWQIEKRFSPDDDPERPPKNAPKDKWLRAGILVGLAAGAVTGAIVGGKLGYLSPGSMLLLGLVIGGVAGVILGGIVGAIASCAHSTFRRRSSHSH